jgi:membrane protease YdiL (CAAX protease family)
MDWQRGARAGSFVVAIPVVVALWNVAHIALRPAPDGATALSFDAVATAALFALLAAAGASLSRAPQATRLGVRPGRLDRRAIAIAALGLLALSHALEGVLTLFGIPESPSLARFDAALIGAPPGALALAVVALALGSATAEELFFRGFVQRGLERTLGAAGAIAVAALAFGAAHADAVHSAVAVPLGLYLGVLTWLDGSIRPAIAAHVANNALAVLEVGFGLRLPESAPIALATIVVGIAIAALALRTAAQGKPTPAGSPAPAA